MKPDKGDMWIDSVLYISIAVFSTIQTFMTSEEVYKYMDPYFIFWVKFAAAIGAAGSGALKMFRSTSFAEHKQSQNGNGSSTTTTKP